MSKTWKPVAAGILEIIAGGTALIVACGLFIAGAVVGFITQTPLWLSTLIPVVAVPLAILGVVDITGGIFTLLRKAWGLALAGAVASLVSSPLPGAVALVLVIISRKEFK